MNVLCVLESASRVDGGIFEAECALQRELVLSQGCAVNVVALRDGFTDLDSKKWLPICPQTAKVLGPKGFGYAPELSHLMGGQFDLAYCAALWKYPSWAVLNWQKKTNKPVVVAPHGSLDAWALNNSRWKKSAVSWLFKQEQLERATCFRALCTAEADAIRSYGLKQRIEIIPNGVELPEGSFKFPDLSLQAQGKKMLLFLGRIHPKKGLVNALRAWAEIRNSPSAIRDSAEWQFVIAGWDQGAHEAELKALCAQLGLRTAFRTTKDTNIHENIQPRIARIYTDKTEAQGGAWASQAGPAFSNPSTSQLARDCENTSPTRSASDPASSLATSYSRPATAPKALNLDAGRSPLDSAEVLFFGPAFGEEKEALLRSADAFILPSFSEGLPMSVLEAWSYGLPVLMTPECNLPEGFANHAALEIRSGGGSFQGSDFSFQHGLRALLEMSGAQRASMGLRGRKLVEEKFTWQKVAAQMRALYEDILPG